MKLNLKKYLVIIGIIAISTIIVYLLSDNKEFITTSTNNIKILANGVEVDTFPTKGEGYIYDGIECINGTTGTWSNETWSLEIDTTKADGCIIYFLKKYTDTILNGSDPVLPSGLIPVNIDESTGTITKADLVKEWYNYENKEWANAVIVNDESYRKSENGTVIPMSAIQQMYVWIPRYEYKKSSIIDASQAIEINFVDINKTNTSNQVLNEDVIVHPAFCWGNYCQEDRENPENIELSGIWVGKFEQSDNQYIKSDMISVYYMNVKSLWSSVRVINQNNHFGLDFDSDVHMIKNIEWGAIAYFTHSIYGKCDQYNTCSEISISTIDNTGSNWVSSNGKNTSTTNNLHGIYDLSGGRGEYVMGIMKMSNNINIYWNPDSKNTSGFVDGDIEKKYYDSYNYGNVGYDNRGFPGDATSELYYNLDKTLKSPSPDWFDDHSDFVNSNHSWFVRGGTFNEGNITGLFFFGSWTGAYGSATTRSVLINL